MCTGVFTNRKVNTLKTRLLDHNKEYNRLFTFLDYENVQPTNNQAEQSLRNIVIFRKICFGTRSAEGSFSPSVLPSLLLTARRQGKHPLDCSKTLFSEETPTAQTVLYKKTSINLPKTTKLLLFLFYESVTKKINIFLESFFHQFFSFRSIVKTIMKVFARI